ncbi:MAG: hypothetical protein K2Q22_13720, partial [Cytophagales bacterium]|nr:hypothetical protein [Cytophagales bacterium]
MMTKAYLAPKIGPIIFVAIYFPNLTYSSVHWQHISHINSSPIQCIASYGNSILAYPKKGNFISTSGKGNYINIIYNYNYLNINYLSVVVKGALYNASSSRYLKWKHKNTFNNNGYALVLGSFVGYSNHIFAGVNDSTTFHDNGVHYTTSGGADWNLEHAGIGGVNCLAIDNINKYLYAGAQNGKVWRRNNSQITSVEPSDFLKEDISKVFPNQS